MESYSFFSRVCVSDLPVCNLQGNWRHAITNRPVSREELMRVLSDLVGLRIRALYFTQSQRLSLGEVGLEEATDTGSGGPAYTVERCSCPPQYAGDSCEVSSLKCDRCRSVQTVCVSHNLPGQLDGWNFRQEILHLKAPPLTSYTYPFTSKVWKPEVAAVSLKRKKEIQ